MESKIFNTNKLLQCSGPMFHLASAFRGSDYGSSLDLSYRQQIINTFDSFERAAFEQKIPLQQVQHVKYALTAFIDELVLSSSWLGRTEWMGKPLQLQFFGEHLAGERFFQRLSELRVAGEQFIDVLEVYYICLQLGFEGVYRMRGLEQLLALQVDLRSQIEMIRGEIDPQISPEGFPKNHLIANVGAKIPFWVIVSVTTAIVFFIYLAYALAIDHQAEKVLTHINASHDVLLQELEK
jgi:type VI secretion system protein ImpK